MHETSFVHCDLKKVVVDLSILSSLFVQIKNAQLLGINICNWTVGLGDVCVCILDTLIHQQLLYLATYNNVIL